MPIRPFRKTKRILTRKEQISMHESAKASAERDHQEKERLIAEGKLRRELIKVDAKTTIVRYIPIDDTISQNTNMKYPRNSQTNIKIFSHFLAHFITFHYLCRTI